MPAAFAAFSRPASPFAADLTALKTAAPKPRFASAPSAPSNRAGRAASVRLLLLAAAAAPTRRPSSSGALGTSSLYGTTICRSGNRELKSRQHKHTIVIGSTPTCVPNHSCQSCQKGVNLCMKGSLMF
eukprot:GHRR01027236.1.p1 GENE.GHRR01027236.1~~GHRR01027236.1.p1  ORF type:complete len:128 (+),score=34.08 GHRR01027236.1:753-1136(+)